MVQSVVPLKCLQGRNSCIAVLSDIFTSYLWNKANIVKFVQATQHQPVATSNIILWADHYVIAMWKTADHMDARSKTVCRAV